MKPLTLCFLKSVLDCLDVSLFPSVIFSFLSVLVCILGVLDNLGVSIVPNTLMLLLVHFFK